MTNYQITIGYKACICVQVKAEDAEKAEAIALEIFKNKKDKMYSSKIELQDDSFAAYGCLNIDETWNMVQS